MLIAVLSLAPQYCSLSRVSQVSVLPSLFLIYLSNLVICSSVLLAGSTFSWSLINRLSKAVSLSKFSENTFISISEPCLNTPQDFCLHEFSSTEWLRINQKLPRLRGVFKTILLSYLLKYFSNKYIFNKQLAHMSADIISVCHGLSKENVIWYSFCSWLSLRTAMSSGFAQSSKGLCLRHWIRKLDPGSINCSRVHWWLPKQQGMLRKYLLKVSELEMKSVLLFPKWGH